MLRDGSRYVSKGNYNVTRIEYLADLLPDARFLVPVRHPVAQVESLLRQHRLFSEYSATDPRVPEYLRAAGHFEFGPQRVPVNLDRSVGRRIAKSWQAGEDATGYALLWNSVYDYGHRLALRAELRSRIEFVRYEDFCRVPRRILRRIARLLQFRRGRRRAARPTARHFAAAAEWLPPFRSRAGPGLGDHGPDRRFPRLSTGTGRVVKISRDSVFRAWWVTSLCALAFACGLAVGVYRSFPTASCRNSRFTARELIRYPSTLSASRRRSFSQWSRRPAAA